MVHDDDEEFFDFYEDSFEQEEDEFEESVSSIEQTGSSDSGVSEKSKKGNYSLFMFLGFILFSCMGLYWFYFSNISDTEIPVIRVGSDTFASVALGSGSRKHESESSFPTDQKSDNSKDTKHISVFAEDLYKDNMFVTDENTEQKSKDIGILTPMPKIDVLKNTSLSDLDNSTVDQEGSNLEDEIFSSDRSDLEGKISDNQELSISSPTYESSPETEEIFVEQLVAVPPPEEDITSEQKKIRIITPNSKAISAQGLKIVDSHSIKADTKALDLKQKEHSRVIEKEISSKTVKYQWVIKAILPGQAVIHNKINGETRSVEVGDRIGYVGAIKSIKKLGEKWVIYGSEHNISQ